MTLFERPKILYVGGFRLPDQNAAALRVLANAKGLERQGYDVVLAQTGRPRSAMQIIEPLDKTEGFESYSMPVRTAAIFDHPSFTRRQLDSILSEHPEIQGILAYNYPALPLARLARHSRTLGIHCLADVTEWYGTRHLRSTVQKIGKSADTALRMRLIHKRLPGLVVISKSLEDYYRRHGKPVLRIPPLVDVDDNKWTIARTESGPQAITTLVYAGQPGAEKERLDLLVAATVTVSTSAPLRLEVFGITATEFAQTYPKASVPSTDIVTFHGRVSHSEALAAVAHATYSVIIRQSTRLTKAGFPTKFAESITLGTPVLTTAHPDLTRLLAGGRNGLVVGIENLAEDIRQAILGPRPLVDSELFHYARYDAEFEQLGRLLTSNP